jgi:hypothetical protein
VEGSTPSKTEKETAGRERVGKVEAPTPTTEREREDRIRLLLGMSALEEGAVVVVGSAGENSEPQDVTSRALGRKGPVIHC